MADKTLAERIHALVTGLAQSHNAHPVAYEAELKAILDKVAEFEADYVYSTGGTTTEANAIITKREAL